jgi:hypothetical protein
MGIFFCFDDIAGSQIQKKYKTQSEKIDQILQRYNYHEFRKYQKRESYHTKVISEQKAEI